MVAELIRSPEDVAKALRDRKPEEIVFVAARSALRVLPLVVLGMNKPGESVQRRRFVDLKLATFWACALARVAATYSNDSKDIAFSARGAANAADSDAEAGNASEAAVAAAANAANAAAFAANAATFAARAAARAANAANAARRDEDGASEVYEEIEADLALAEARGAFALATSPLWAVTAPDWASKAWALLSTLLPPEEGWTVWTSWYEAILAGRQLWPALEAEVRQNLEVQIVTLPISIWEKGPVAANAAIARLIEAAPPPAIAIQGPGPRYMLGDADKIVPLAHWEYDGDGNIPKRMQSLLPLTQRAAQDLLASLPQNDPYKLSRDVSDYFAAINQDARQIDWAFVYGLGVFVENTAAAAEREIADCLVPPLEAPAKSALDNLRTLHSNLIMASGEGRALQEEADGLRLTGEQHESLRNDVTSIAGNLEKDRSVASPEAVATVVKASEQIGQGPHPERGSEYGLATMGNVAVVLVSAATLGSLIGIGAYEAGALGGALGGGAAWVGNEGLKKSAMYANATAALGRSYDAAFKAGGEAIQARLSALVPFRNFVSRNEAPLRRIAENTTRLRWMLSYIDFIVGSQRERIVSAVGISTGTASVVGIGAAKIETRKVDDT